MGGEQVGLGFDLGLGHPAEHVRPHIMGLGRRSVVGVAADVQVVVVLRQRLVGDHGSEAGDVGVPLVGVDDLLDVLGVEVVLGPARPQLGVGVDEHDLALPLSGFTALGPQDEHAGGDARAVEQVGGEPDDGVEEVVLDEALADMPLSPTSEQDPVGHDRADHAALPQHADHVLHEHQVGLFARLGAEAVGEPLPEGEVVRRVVLREGRVRDHPVEAHQLAALDVQRLRECVAIAEVSIGDTVEDHVHLRDGPDPAVVLLPVQPKILRVAPVLVDMLGRENQHAAGSRARVVDLVALLRIGDAYHHSDHGSRGVELSPLLASRVGELADQVLVGGPQEIGKLEVVVEQSVLAEVVNQPQELLVGQP